MRRRDIRAVGLLASEASGVVTTLVRDMHAGIAGRVFSSVGPSSRPTQLIHDGLTRVIYGAVDQGLRGATTLGGVVASEMWGRDGDEALETRDDTGGAMAAINGIYGDQLAGQDNPLALTMQIRQHGQPVALTEDGLSSAFPRATGRLAVFVHGWCLTERSWWRRPRSGNDERSYGERLHSDGGWNPVYLRYNTGLHISQNGRTLADILERLQLLWPVPIDELVLVGHSMGGLVVRSACYYGVQQHHWWTAAVRHVVCLGSPHMGADLEKGVNVAAWAMTRLPETRAIAS
jgi:PGAP1-like protein